MLRIWFGSEDLERVRVARRPHALWETVLSLQTLRTRQRTPLTGWRNAALARLATPRATAALRTLRPLVPVRGYFPDFLTPAADDLEGGIAAVLGTPRRMGGRRTRAARPGTYGGRGRRSADRGASHPSATPSRTTTRPPSPRTCGGCAR